MVKSSQQLTVITIFLFALVFVAQAELYVFPAKGQSQQQTEQDKFSCYGWAKNQTGFDPMNPPRVQAAAPKSGQVFWVAPRVVLPGVQSSGPLPVMPVKVRR